MKKTAAPHPVLLLVLLILQFPGNRADAQNNADLPNTLLWRISGRHLAKPSYLFGTMHLSDKRLFNFTDSVYAGIEHTQGLAIELNPDEMMAYLINQTFQERSNGTRISAVMPPDELRQYDKRLSKKFGKPSDQITTADVSREKRKWMNEALETGEMETFIDTYLYNIARRQGKWVGGIEDMIDQAGYLEDNIDRSDIRQVLADDDGDAQNKAALERMIALYAAGDLRGIANFFTDAATDRVLHKRNVKMVRRMDSLSAIRTMFFAVGAAHLPGDSGLITLLRQHGFTVEPVISAGRIKPADYMVKDVDLPWVTVEDTGFYKVSMPGIPVSMKLAGAFNMKFFFDLSTMTGCFSMAIHNPKMAANKDSIMQVLAKRMFKRKGKVDSRQITHDQVSGKEFSQVTDNVSMRIQVFLDQGTLFLTCYLAMKKEKTGSADAEKFFRSLVMQEYKTLPAAVPEAFHDSLGAVQVSAPVKFEKVPAFNVKSPSINTEGYGALNPELNVYFIFMIKQANPGYTMSVDSLVSEDFVNRMKDTHDYMNASPLELGSGHLTEFFGRQKEDNMYTRAVSSVRSNRNVLLMAVGDSAGLYSSQVTDWFASLRYLPLPPVSWSRQTTPDGAVSVIAPDRFRVPAPELEMQNMCIAFDSSSLLNYVVAVDTFNRYTWYTHDSLFYKKMVRQFVEDDELVTYTEHNTGGIEWKDILIRQAGGADKFYRIRMQIRDSILYRLTVRGERALITDARHDSMFNSMTVLKGPQGTFFHTPKTSLILTDLHSPDQATRRAAYDALAASPFTAEDLPALVESFNDEYDSPDDSTRSNLVPFALANEIAIVIDSTEEDAVPDDATREIIMRMAEHIKGMLVTADSAGFASYASRFTHLLGSLKTPGAGALLLSWNTGENLYFKQEVLNALIRYGYRLDEKLLDEVAAEPSMRQQLFDDLKEQQKESQFPAKYHTREKMSEAEVYYVFAEEMDSSPDSVEFIGTRDVSYLKKKYQVRLYKVTTDEEIYLGIVGGYAVNGKDADLTSDFSGIYWEEEFDKQQVNTFLKSYMKGLEED